jgi:hypothetical protein
MYSLSHNILFLYIFLYALYRENDEVLNTIVDFISSFRTQNNHNNTIIYFMATYRLYTQ